MNDVLLISVGMTAAPLINCIRSQRPQRVVFLCSEATRCKVDEVLAEVPIPRFDPEQDVVILQQRRSRKADSGVVNELDRLDCVYTIVWQQLQRLRQEEPNARIAVDYTGGSKTMAAGLAMAAVDDGRVQLLLTTTENRPSSGDVNGATLPIPIPLSAIQITRLLQRDLPALLHRYDYAAAESLVHRVRTGCIADGSESRLLLRLQYLLQAFDAWDRFDHRQALIAFEQVSHDAQSSAWLRRLKGVISSRAILDRVAQEEKWPQLAGHGLESVEDLLRNAERCAAQERYDDAVGRLYRSMELSAQILMRIGIEASVGEGGLLTADLAIERLPAELQKRFVGKSKPITIGLKDTWDLLADLGHPAGLVWLKHRPAILDQLQVRNNSLFAHGFQPIAYGSWRQMSSVIIPFLDTVIDGVIAGSAHIRLMQLPSSLEDLFSDATALPSLAAR